MQPWREVEEDDKKTDHRVCFLFCEASVPLGYMQSVGGQFDRLVRIVQETGERVVVSLEPGKDPVVLLPLAVYEQLTQRQAGREGGQQVVQAPRRREPEEIGQMGGDLRSVRGDVPRRDAPVETRMPEHRLPPQKDVQFEAAADAWDGEEGGEYDAERIFAQIDREKMNHTPSQAPDRLQASVSRVSEAFQGGWAVGSGGQRLPIRGQASQGEERFSLGAG